MKDPRKPDAAARQLTLELAPDPRFGVDDFLVSDSNAQAFDTIERWPNWPDSVLLVLGPTGAGKSHLATIWANRSGAKVLKGEDLAGADPATLAACSAVLIEDADAIGAAEAQLFHLLNLIREKKGALLLTARSWPDAWGLKTADLLSRLRLAPTVEIGEPDDALVRAVLVKLFLDRQLMVDAGVVEYIAIRLDRSLAAARTFVEVLDREALARGRAITKAMAGDVLRLLDENIEL